MFLFRSEVSPENFTKKLDYKSKLMFIGSCFTENIGKKMSELKFQVKINPFGIIYNPLSVAQSLKNMMETVWFTESDLHFFNEKWISFSHHGRFSGINQKQVLSLINSELQEGNRFLVEGNFLFITFGTAWVYKFKKNNQVVSNCHKIPTGEFEHFMLEVDEIVDQYKTILKNLNQLNPDLRVVFTVSPVRHWKDGPVNNLYSKSVLVVAIQRLLKIFDFVFYFPSYEIMMDDLRDYRFYAEDLFHPNQTGIDYIWEKFADCFISEEAKETMGKIGKILKAYTHKPFYPQTQAYRKFLENTLAVIESICKTLPQISLENERIYFIQEMEHYFSNPE
jgi:hypothetical protein